MSNTSSPPGAATPATDDFESIKGLGAKSANRLYEAGVSTFARLGAMTVADVSEIVKGISTETIEDWIDKARRIDIERKQASNPPESHHNTDSSGNSQRPAAFTVKLLLDEENHVRRTIINHDIPDGAEKKWAGWDEHRMINFIIEHAKLSIPPPKPVPQPGASPEPSGNLGLEIIETITQEVDGIAPSNIINANKAWSLDVKWELSGATKDTLTGNWLVRAHLESIGPGPEYSLPSGEAARVPLGDFTEPEGTTYTYQYTYKMNVAASAAAAGTYKLVTAIIREREDDRPFELTDFFEGMLQLYAQG